MGVSDILFQGSLGLVGVVSNTSDDLVLQFMLADNLYQSQINSK